MASTDKQSNQNHEPDEWAAGREERERRGNEALKYQRYLQQQIAASQQRQAEMSNANQLRMNQKAAKDKEWQGAGSEDETGKNEGKKGDEASADGEPKTLRQKLAAAKQAMNLKQKAKDKLEEKVTAPARAVTNRALQWAWKALIPSWGLSSIWINIHVFLKTVFGEKLFCKLGDEWLPPVTAETTGEAGKTVSKTIGLVEIMVLAFIDIIIFFIIVGFFAMFTDEGTFKTMTGEANKNQPAAVQPAK